LSKLKPNIKDEDEDLSAEKIDYYGEGVGILDQFNLSKITQNEGSHSDVENSGSFEDSDESFVL
jgi:hypothetical protein